MGYLETSISDYYYTLRNLPRIAQISALVLYKVRGNLDCLKKYNVLEKDCAPLNYIYASGK